MQYPDGAPGPGTWKGTTELYGQSGKGWRKHFVQCVPLLCQQHTTPGCRQPASRWDRAEPWELGQSFVVLAPARFLSTAFPPPPFLPSAFPLLAIASLCLNVGKMETCPFPPARPACYHLTLPFSPSIQQSICVEAGVLERPSSSSSSSSQLTADGCDSPARLEETLAPRWVTAARLCFPSQAGSAAARRWEMCCPLLQAPADLGHDAGAACTHLTPAQHPPPPNKSRARRRGGKCDWLL